MFFKKKKDMVDIRELQKRGVVRIPKKNEVVPTNKDGYVEFGSSKSDSSLKEGGNKEFFGYSSKANFSNEKDGYNKKEVDEMIIKLDNKIYKLEQRLEVIERKVGVGNSFDSNVGGMIGW